MVAAAIALMFWIADNGLARARARGSSAQELSTPDRPEAEQRLWMEGLIYDGSRVTRDAKWTR